MEDKVLRTVEKHPLSFDSLKKTPVTGRREKNCRQVRSGGSELAAVLLKQLIPIAPRKKRRYSDLLVHMFT